MKKGKNLGDLQDLNRSQILHYLLQHRGCSRAELGEATGLTQASITKIIRSLIEGGAVYEVGFSEGKKGRRSVGLSFRYDNYKILAVRLGWRRIDMAVFDFQGQTFGNAVSMPIQAVTMENIADAEHIIKENAAQFCREYPDILAVGISSIGPYYRETGAVMLPPYSKSVENRKYHNLGESLTAQLPRPVFIEHDADIGALGYWRFHTDITKKSVIMNMLIGDGIGIGIVDSGSITSGTSFCSAEMGHITIDYNGRKCFCGSNGCLNAYCCVPAMIDITREQLPEYPESELNRYAELSLPVILKAADHGDPLAVKIIRDEGAYLGHGILSLLQIMQPDTIVISGSIAAAGEPLLNSVRETFEARRSSFIVPPEILLFSSSADLMLEGAAAYAMERILAQPTEYLHLDEPSA